MVSACDGRIVTAKRFGIANFLKAAALPPCFPLLS
jgi:hypothetical protein